MLSIHKNKRIAWSNIMWRLWSVPGDFLPLINVQFIFGTRCPIFRLIRFVTRAENLFNWFRVINLSSILIRNVINFYPREGRGNQWRIQFKKACVIRGLDKVRNFPHQRSLKINEEIGFRRASTYV